MKYNNFLILIGLFYLSCNFFACKPMERIAPENPPEASLFLDLTYFQYQEDSVSYYNDAALKIQFWKNVINDSLEFQRSFYSNIVDNKLQYQNGETWLSTKNIIIDDIAFIINLFDITYTDSMYTKLFLSKDTIYTNTLILDGISYADYSGNWTVNRPDTANTFQKLLTINYKIDNEVIKNIKLTYNQQGNYNGNYIFFNDSIDGNYNSYIEIFEKINDHTAYIEFNNSTFEGRIKDENFYGDNNWRCWNSEHLNSDCN